MFKRKVVFPDNNHHLSPYQLEDCQRRLHSLKRDIQPITFTRVDDNTIHFQIRQIKVQQVAFPMIAFEISGTLRRWHGTETRIDHYRLKRFSARIDTWAVMFIVVSTIVAVSLMLPALFNLNENISMLMLLVLLAVGMSILPITVWMRHTLSLNIEQDIHHLHGLIMQQLDIDN